MSKPINQGGKNTMNICKPVFNDRYIDDYWLTAQTSWKFAFQPSLAFEWKVYSKPCWFFLKKKGLFETDCADFTFSFNASEKVTGMSLSCVSVLCGVYIHAKIWLDATCTESVGYQISTSRNFEFNIVEFQLRQRNFRQKWAYL